MEPVAFELALEIGSDFADIFAVKDHDFALGDPRAREPLPPPVDARASTRSTTSSSSSTRRARGAHAGHLLAAAATSTAAPSRYRVELEPREAGSCASTSSPRSTATGGAAGGRRGASARSSRASATRSPPGSCACRSCAPSWDDLDHAFAQSVSDLAVAADARRQHGIGQLPAAGMPWFMTVFGRDTIITCLQTLLFGPELARGALEVLAELQATEDDPSIDAEPGKIVHEVRHGKAAKDWFARYYGTVDATPLYLVLLSEVWRWTDDATLVRSCASRRCARSSGSTPTATATATASSSTSGARERGLDNQSWKDSRRLAALRGRADRRGADRAVRGAGLRLRREAADGRARARGVARPRARRAARAGGRRAAASASTRRSGSTSAAATTRSRSTARRSRSTRSARTSATCSGAGSSRRSASTRSSTR